MNFWAQDWDHCCGSRVCAANDKMAVPMSGHQFRTSPPHPETGIKMAHAMVITDWNRSDDMPQYLKQPPEVFKKLLGDAGIAL